MCSLVQLPFLLLVVYSSLVQGTYVNPNTFLDARLAKGTWIAREDVTYTSNIFEGGWIWTSSGELQTTQVCRGKASPRTPRGFGPIEPGELVNEICFVSGYPRFGGLPGGVKQYKEYEVLMKAENEVYEWEDFDSGSGYIPDGAVIGGIGAHYEPILVCRKFFNGTAPVLGGERKSKAVLGQFNPADGKCFYEVELGSTWLKWDVSVGTEEFQLLVLRGRGKQQCAEPRKSKNQTK